MLDSALSAWSFFHRTVSVVTVLAVACGVAASLGGATTAVGQTHTGLDPSLSVTQYQHRAWSTTDGLPQVTVKAITQDADGYLWIGTQEGVARFDGTRFHVHNRRETPELDLTFYARTLHADADTLWIGTQEHGLFAQTPSGFERFGPDAGLAGEEVSDVVRDADGRLWVGTFDAGLFTGSGKGFASVAPPGDSVGTRVTALSAPPDSAEPSLWIGTDHGLLALRGDSTRLVSPRSPPASPFVTALHRDARGTLWVGTRDGLYRLADDGLAPVAPGDGVLSRGTIFALESDPHGRLWVGTGSRGVVRFAPDAGSVERFDTRDGLSHDRVTALHVDREGSLWIGTEGGGLNQLYSGKLVTLDTAEGLSDDITMAVFEDAAGALWVGTEGAGLNRVDPDGSVRTFGVDDGFGSGVVLSLAETRPGDRGGAAVWAGTYGGGLHRIAGASVRRFDRSDGLPGESVFALHRGPSGALWVGTDDGLARYEGGSGAGAFDAYTTDDGLSSNSITSLLETPDGTLWVGTYNGGLNRLDAGRARPDAPPDPAPVSAPVARPVARPVLGDSLLGSSMILALHADSTGALWVGTYGGGLARYDDGALTRFTTEDGLFDDRIYQILESNGALWMSTNRGVFSVPFDAFEAYEAGRASHLEGTAFTRQDDLPGEVNGGFQPAGWRTADGHLVFPTDHGVVRIDPNNVPRNTTPPPVVVEAFLIDETPVSLADGGTFRVPPGAENVQIRFTAPTFIAPQEVRFFYKLEGFNTLWHDARGQRVATYTNLDPGTYTFRVRAVNRDGVASRSAAVLAFYQAPFFYQTAWFYGLCLFGLAALVTGAFRLRVRHLKRRKRELERQVDDRTRELKTLNKHLEQRVDAQLQTILQEREAYEAQLRTEKERAEEAARLKSAILNNVSHELRTPMTGILGYSDLLIDEGDDTVERFARKIHESGERLMETLNAILELSTLESAAAESAPETVAVDAVVHRVARRLRSHAEAKGLTLDVNVCATSTRAHIEEQSLARVVHVLVDNAVTFTDAGCVTVTVDDAGDGLRLRVRDTGIGISDTFMPHLFEPFEQEDMSDDRDVGGKGLNMSIAKRLVDLSGGSIRVESEKGVGTTVDVLLPRFHANGDA